MAALNLEFDEADTDLTPDANGYSDLNAFRVLKRYLEPDGDLNMYQAAKLLYKMLASTEEERGNIDQPDLFSCVFLDVAQQIPYHHPAQMRFVRLIKYLAASDRVNARSSMEVNSICSLNFYLFADIYSSMTRSIPFM
jgi:hypothetical protein